MSLSYKTLCISFILLISMSNTSYSASYDCSKTKTKAEVTICNHPKLSALDDLMEVTYRQFLTHQTFLYIQKDNSQVIMKQKKWLTSRNKCSRDTLCLFESYQKQIFFLFDKMNDDDEVSGVLDLNNIHYLVHALPYLDSNDIIRAVALSNYQIQPGKGSSNDYSMIAFLTSTNNPEKIITSASGDVKDKNLTNVIILKSIRGSLTWTKACIIRNLGPTSRRSMLEFVGNKLYRTDNWMRRSVKHLTAEVSTTDCTNFTHY